MIMRGNVSDCICARPNGVHEGFCDAYRLSEFLKKCAAIKNIYCTYCNDFVNEKHNHLEEINRGKKYEDIN